MKKELEQVSKIVTEVYALQVEKLALIIFLKDNAQPGYTQDQMGTMMNVLKKESRVQEIDEISGKLSGEIIEILNEVYPEWEPEVQAAQGFQGFLKNHGIEDDLLTEEQQKKISKDAIGRELTIDMMVEELSK